MSAISKIENFIKEIRRLDYDGEYAEYQRLLFRIYEFVERQESIGYIAECDDKMGIAFKELCGILRTSSIHLYSLKEERKNRCLINIKFSCGVKHPNQANCKYYDYDEYNFQSTYANCNPCKYSNETGELCYNHEARKDVMAKINSEENVSPHIKTDAYSKKNVDTLMCNKQH